MAWPDSDPSLTKYICSVSSVTSSEGSLALAYRDYLRTHHKQENLRVNFLLCTLNKHSRHLLHAQPEFLRKPQFALQWSEVACWAKHGLQVRPPGLNPSSRVYCVLKGKITLIQFLNLKDLYIYFLFFVCLAVFFFNDRAIWTQAALELLTLCPKVLGL